MSNTRAFAPPHVSPKWIQKLDLQYEQAEQAFFRGAFQQSISICRSIVADYLVLTPGPQTLDLSQRPSLSPSSTPVRCVELILRSQFELGLSSRALGTVNLYFSSPAGAPVSILLILCSIFSLEQLPNEIITVLETTLRAREGSMLPDEYEKLAYILVSEGYIPSKKFKDGLIFIAADRRLATNVPFRSELISQLEHTKESEKEFSRDLDTTDRVDQNFPPPELGAASPSFVPKQSQDNLGHFQSSQGQWPIPEGDSTALSHQAAVVFSEKASVEKKDFEHLEPSGVVDKLLHKCRIWLQSLFHSIGFEKPGIFAKTLSFIKDLGTKLGRFLWKMRHAIAWLIIVYTCLPLVRLLVAKTLSFPSIAFVVSELRKALKIAFTIGTGGHI